MLGLGNHSFQILSTRIVFSRTVSTRTVSTRDSLGVTRQSCLVCCAICLPWISSHQTTSSMRPIGWEFQLGNSNLGLQTLETQTTCFKQVAWQCANQICLRCVERCTIIVWQSVSTHIYTQFTSNVAAALFLSFPSVWNSLNLVQTLLFQSRDPAFESFDSSKRCVFLSSVSSRCGSSRIKKTIFKIWALHTACRVFTLVSRSALASRWSSAPLDALQWKRLAS